MFCAHSWNPFSHVLICVYKYQVCMDMQIGPLPSLWAVGCVQLYYTKPALWHFTALCQIAFFTRICSVDMYIPIGKMVQCNDNVCVQLKVCLRNILQRFKQLYNAQQYQVGIAYAYSWECVLIPGDIQWCVYLAVEACTLCLFFLTCITGYTNHIILPRQPELLNTATFYWMSRLKFY